MSLRDTLLAVLVALIWGVNFVVIDAGMGDVPPLVFVAVRFSVVLLPALWLVPRPQARWQSVVLVGLFMSLGQFGFLYAAIYAGMPAGLAALVLQAQVLLTLVIAAGALGERPSRAQWAGVAIGSAGLVVVALGRGAGTGVLALVLCLAAALSWAIGNVVMRASGAQGGLSMTVWSAAVVPVPALLLAVLLDGGAAVVAGFGAFDLAAVGSTLYTSVLASLVGYGIFTALLGRNPASAVVPWILVVPPVAMVAAAVFQHEVPTPAEAVGGAVMLIGAYAAVRPSRSSAWGRRLGYRRVTSSACPASSTSGAP